jgi:protein-S-isoprenylcysteine O-methyltransferase Ste14
MGACRRCRACAQLARALAVPAGRPACRLVRRDGVCPRAGAVRLGHRYTRAGSNVPTNRPTTTIVERGPYRFTRNPIYLGMFLGLIGSAIAFDNLWLLMMLVPFALVIRFGVVVREEAYLERKFGDAYRGYRSRVRRWL